MVEKALPEVEGREGPFQRAEGSVPEASRMTRSVKDPVMTGTWQRCWEQDEEEGG